MNCLHFGIAVLSILLGIMPCQGEERKPTDKAKPAGNGDDAPAAGELIAEDANPGATGRVKIISSGNFKPLEQTVKLSGGAQFACSAVKDDAATQTAVLTVPNAEPIAISFRKDEFIREVVTGIDETAAVALVWLKVEFGANFACLLHLRFDAGKWIVTRCLESADTYRQEMWIDDIYRVQAWPIIHCEYSRSGTDVLRTTIRKDGRLNVHTGEFTPFGKVDQWEVISAPRFKASGKAWACLLPSKNLAIFSNEEFAKSKDLPGDVMAGTYRILLDLTFKKDRLCWRIDEKGDFECAEEISGNALKAAFQKQTLERVDIILQAETDDSSEERNRKR